MSDPLSFLSGEQPAETEVVSETPETPAIAPETPETPADAPQDAPDRPRGPDGKFAKADAPTPPETPPAPQEPGHVPITALLDERDKRQALEKRLAALESAQPPAEPLPPEAQHQAELHNLRQQTQRLSVEVEHGKKAVQDAFEWAHARCDTDPAFNAQMAAQIGLVGNPYQVAVDAYRHHTELEEFNAWKASKAAGQPQSAPIPPAQETPPPKSLANAPGNGAAGTPFVDARPGAAFDSVIPR